MGETKPRDIIQHASSIADSDQEFTHTIKHGNKIQISRAILLEFFTDSSIQGFKYFCERKRHWSERTFWMIMFVIATSSSCYMIHKAYTRWDSTPVIVSLSEKATPVWKVPFPAVTICPEVKVSSTMLNLTQTLHDILNSIEAEGNIFANLTQKKLDYLISLAHICDMDYISDLDLGRKIANSERLIRDLNHTSIKLDDSIWGCSWRNKDKIPSRMFRPILTEDGFCFTFNSLDSQDIYSEIVAPELLSVTGNPNATRWNLEIGYNDTGLGRSSLDSYPFRILGTGTQNGLQLLLTLTRDDLDYMCQGPIQGFKVVLSAPAEIPLPSRNYFRVPLEQEVLVSVKPNVLETSEELHNYEPKRKLCIMQSENPLKFFKVYTQRHCELERTSDFMKERCGCVFFSYPRDQNTSICGVKKFKCVEDIEKEMVEKTFLSGLNESSNANDQNSNCLPSCTSINYDIESSSAQYDIVKFFRAYPEKSSDSIDFDKIAFSSLNIYFKENQFFTSKRAELYGVTKFLAECGGILGLFIGVTALSFVEIFYYFTLRLIWTLRMYRYGKREDSSNNPLQNPLEKTYKY